MLDELGQLMGGGQPQMGKPDPGLKGQWDGWISNPANQAAVLNFGLGLMVPQWGGAPQQFANAAAGAAQGAAATQEFADAETQKREAIARREGERQEDRALRREEIASRRKASIEDRTLRNAERSYGALARQGDSERKAVNKLLETQQLMGELTPEQTSELNARQKRLERIEAQMGRLEQSYGGQGAILEGIAPGETSGISAPTGAGGDPTGGQSAAPEAKGKRSLSQALNEAESFISKEGVDKVKAFLSNPNRGAFLAKKNFSERELKAAITLYEAKQSGLGAAAVY